MHRFVSDVFANLSNDHFACINEKTLMYMFCDQWSGMKESSEFADKLFDALARKRCIASPSITEAELLEFWEQITDTSFDARLETFFGM